MKIARLYIRVSSSHQELERQNRIYTDVVSAGYYVAGIYKEKASGARADRPELLRLIDDLQPGETVVAEKIDRISRLPLPEAGKLVNSIRDKGAKLSVPDLVDLSELVPHSDGVTKVVIESVQDLLLKLALQMARDDYETRRERQRQGIELAKERGRYRGRQANTDIHQQIIALRKSGMTISKTASVTACSISQVKRIWALHNQGKL
ncbi:recombinase family protein [Vibrio lentus]|uniref:recombinase family protein n=1 Tax=Vibrio lentus TaxID=136468 RepID=UPI000C86519B|nr:recombinase family protein [Vibrio lentus]PMM31154.1 resolvase [Vibrio lentus]